MPGDINSETRELNRWELKLFDTGNVGLDLDEIKAITRLKEAAAASGTTGSDNQQLVRIAAFFVGCANRWNDKKLRQNFGAISTLESLILLLDNLSEQAEHLCKKGSLSEKGTELAQELVRRRSFFKVKLKFYQDVRYLGQPQTVANIRRMFESHTFQEGGRSFVNLYKHQHLERLNLNYIDSPIGKNVLAKEWAQFMQDKVDEKRNPYNSLGEFVLQHVDLPRYRRNIHNSRPYFDADQRIFYRLIYTGEEYEWDATKGGMLHAIYNASGNRYIHFLDNPIEVVLANHYKVHTSLAYTDRRMKNVRNEDDLKDGELYVMSHDRKAHEYPFYTFPLSEVHSVLLAGEAVMSAGIIVIKDGKVLAIDNKSGHYQPKWPHLHQAVCELEFHDVMAPDAVVVLETGGQNMPFLKDDFINLGNQRFPYIATREVLARYYKHFKGPPCDRNKLSKSAAEKWQNPEKAYWDFLKESFPKNMNRWEAVGDMFFIDIRIPDIDTWKRDTSRTTFLTRSRSEWLMAVDNAIEHVHQALRTAQQAQQWPHPFFDTESIERAFMLLLSAVNTWLNKRPTSPRRIPVEKLRDEIIEDIGFLKEMRRSEPEFMPERSVQGL